MCRRGLYALILGALVARLLLPAFHFHDAGRGGECRHKAEHRVPGPAADAAHEDCAVCELLAVKVPCLAPESPRVGEASRPLTGERTHISFAAPRSAHFSLAGAPRGPPASTPA